MRLPGRRGLRAVLLACACSRHPEGAVVVEVAGAARTLAQSELAALPVAQVEVRGHAYTGVLRA